MGWHLGGRLPQYSAGPPGALRRSTSARPSESSTSAGASGLLELRGDRPVGAVGTTAKG